jgi:hypothetical protein
MTGMDLNPPGIYNFIPPHPPTSNLSPSWDTIKTHPLGGQFFNPIGQEKKAKYCTVFTE